MLSKSTSVTPAFFCLLTLISLAPKSIWYIVGVNKYLLRELEMISSAHSYSLEVNQIRHGKVQ